MRGIIFAILLYLAAGHPDILNAELKRCDGIWTDRPCKGTPEETLDAAPPRSPRSAHTVVQDDKKLVVQGLLTDAYEARRTYDISFSTRAVERQCQLESTTLENCIELVRDAHRDLQEFVLLAKKVQRSDEKTETTEAKDSDYSTNIVIIEDEYPMFIDRHPHRPPYRPGHPSRPDHSHRPHKPGVPDHGGNSESSHRPGPFEGYGSRFK